MEDMKTVRTFWILDTEQILFFSGQFFFLGLFTANKGKAIIPQERARVYHSSEWGAREQEDVTG